MRGGLQVQSPGPCVAFAGWWQRRLQIDLGNQKRGRMLTSEVVQSNPLFKHTVRNRDEIRGVHPEVSL